MDVHRCSSLAIETENSHYSVQTITAGHALLKWPTRTLILAELLARKLSVAAIGNATYPNPVIVIDSNGKTQCQYPRGIRPQKTPTASYDNSPHSRRTEQHNAPVVASSAAAAAGLVCAPGRGTLGGLTMRSELNIESLMTLACQHSTRG